MEEEEENNVGDEDDVDEYGNLKGFIDYDCKDEFDHREFDKQLKGIKQKRKKLP